MLTISGRAAESRSRHRSGASYTRMPSAPAVTKRRVRPDDVGKPWSRTEVEKVLSHGGVKPGDRCRAKAISQLSGRGQRLRPSPPQSASRGKMFREGRKGCAGGSDTFARRQSSKLKIWGRHQISGLIRRARFGFRQPRVQRAEARPIRTKLECCGRYRGSAEQGRTDGTIEKVVVSSRRSTPLTQHAVMLAARCPR